MKVLTCNGSPRKNGNTATLLNKALEGSASKLRWAQNLQQGVN